MESIGSTANTSTLMESSLTYFNFKMAGPASQYLSFGRKKRAPRNDLFHHKKRTMYHPSPGREPVRSLTPALSVSHPCLLEACPCHLTNQITVRLIVMDCLVNLRGGSGMHLYKG